MKQLPDGFWTRQHGPVLAYARSGDDVHASCVTWRGEHVRVHHDDLLPMPEEYVAGGAEVADLLRAVRECMAPDCYDSGAPRPARSRLFSVGDDLIGQLMFWSGVYAPGEIVNSGFGKPLRIAEARSTEE